MKILHAIYDDVQNPWCGGGGAVRALEISRRLAQRHDITLLSGAYPGAAAQEIRHGVRIRRVGTDRSYLLSRLSFSALASSLLARETFDLWVYNFSAFSPILASAGLRRRCVLEFFHRIAGHAVRKLPVFGLPARIAEEYTLRSFNHLVTISPSVAKQISRARGTQGLHLVYTGVDDACFDIPVSEQDYILYVRDELAIAKGTFEPIFFGLKFFYVGSLGYQWPLFTKKKYASHAIDGCPTSAPMTTVAA